VVKDRVPFSFTMVQSLLSSDSTSSPLATPAHASTRTMRIDFKRSMVLSSTNGRAAILPEANVCERGLETLD